MTSERDVGVCFHLRVGIISAILIRILTSPSRIVHYWLSYLLSLSSSVFYLPLPLTPVVPGAIFRADAFTRADAASARDDVE